MRKARHCGSEHVLLVLIAVMLLAAACGSDSFSANLGKARLAAPKLVSVSMKTTSGAPAGIFVTWTREPSAACQGYYLYRYTEDNRPPEPEPEDNPPFAIELRVNGGEMIPQPDSGDTVTFNDVFDPIVGETYYYRVTAVDDQEPPHESYPSVEEGWTVHGQNIADMSPTSAYWGEDITITGDTFGVYDDETDSVRFSSIGENYVYGAIVSWSDTEIIATVPQPAVTAKVTVIVEGTFAMTDDELTILSPTITSIAPAEGFVEQDLVLAGVNFGTEQGDSTVAIGTVDATSAVSSWGDTEITLSVPVATIQDDVQVTVDGRVSNGIQFTPRPELMGTVPTTVQFGEPIVISGRKFLGTEGNVYLDATELVVNEWADDEITVSIAGDIGEHTLKVVTSEGTVGNDYAYTIVAPLSVSLAGISPVMLYTPDDVPVLVVETAADADSVELVVDGAVMGDPVSIPPFSGLTLDFATLVNGNHSVRVRAHRRTIQAESLLVPIKVYSLIGDINADGVVDIADRNLLDTLRGMTSADPGFLPWYDTDSDGDVTEADLSALGYNWNNAN